MIKRVFRNFACDFETTVYDGQQQTEVWSAACVELNTEDVRVFHTIEDFLSYLKGIKKNIRCYFHNLKFDGSFILDHLLRQGFKQAYIQYGKKETEVKWLREKDMPTNSFKYSISDMGIWYSLTIKYHNYVVEFVDSVKLLPFSLQEIGYAFETKHKKLEMEYKGFRYPGCEITEEEMEYIKNDVLVLKEALEFMFKEGHNKLTIGSCCVAEFKKLVRTKSAYEIKELFPDLTLFKCGDVSAHKFIKRAYRGGWCYLVSGKENHVFHNGVTADVNSLYPSMMHSESGNYYPVGEPNYWCGNFIDDNALKEKRYYYIRFKCGFKLKRGYLPFVQIKNNLLYRPNECLESSLIYDSDTGEYSNYVKSRKGDIYTDVVELTMSGVDFDIFKKHYNIHSFEILDGVWFHAEIGIFDNYIDTYKQIKMNSKGAKRTLAKLFLNNLYGKLASDENSSFKLAYLDEEENVKFHLIPEFNKKTFYIAAGAAVTSYARRFTITAAQKNYHGKKKPGFIYADTDSIHCDLSPDDVKGCAFHDNAFNCWKMESTWDEAIFLRQKAYIEHVIEEDLKPCDPHHVIKCAGMQDRSKELLILSLSDKELNKEDFNEDEQSFLFDSDGNKITRTYADFDGIEVPGALKPKRIRGGILLVEQWYKIR